MKKLGVILLILGIGIIIVPFINVEFDKKEISKNIDKWDEKKIDDKNNLINVDGKKIIGKINVLDTGEQIPVIEGATEENLKGGATLYENGIYPGDNGTAVILGHRETTFGFLENIKIGDEIEIETIKSKNKFKLEKTYIVKPDDPLILKQESYPGVTLETCYPFHYFGSAPDRFIAKYKLIENNV